MKNQNVGGCMFCGQTYIPTKDYPEYNSERGVTEENWLDYQATMHCKCDEARGFQHREMVKTTTKNNIDYLLGEDYPKASKLLKYATDILVEGSVGKVSVDVSGRIKAYLIRGAKGDIKFRRVVTDVDEMES